MGFLTISNRPRKEIIFPYIQSRAVLTRGNYQLSIINYQLMKPFLDPEIIHQFEYIRHQEVVKFLIHNNCLGDSWVAIDDIPEHYPPDTQIVVTDAYNGFDASAALALELYLLAS
ncbi:MAG: hypothetical protein F6K25_08330 [Okeania sp. SIO2G4]|uniref:hypothetical protein n=1 Tax=unclassified Okeania TaxID=2634635 RepID=UPI0013B86387|nr:MULTISPECIES: hypothetical protein [unclassified Okeania]NEP43517.1 hypothetical protein [Okeania sp. SIO2H7]NEP71905.1 hypothetical protein [Okeania sp. SIO2G5]NEP93051.1 hypothetical protein [Okeania sp. SIO2F5]NEQ90719.1 hypothetical protein [Okeania sp. SIO2G4]